jgi:hypothetical protein
MFFQDYKQLQHKIGHIGAWCDDEKLNWWMSGQRYLRKIDKMPSERIKLLDDAGFVWALLPSKTSVKSPRKRKQEVIDLVTEEPISPRNLRRRKVESDQIQEGEEEVIIKESKVSPPDSRDQSPMIINEDIAEAEENITPEALPKQDKESDQATWQQNMNLYL